MDPYKTQCPTEKYVWVICSRSISHLYEVDSLRFLQILTNLIQLLRKAFPDQTPNEHPMSPLPPFQLHFFIRALILTSYCLFVH